MALAVVTLLTSGHPLSAIWSYTLTQVFGFVELASDVRRRQLGELSIAVRMAHHAEGKDYTKFLRSLEHD